MGKGLSAQFELQTFLFRRAFLNLSLKPTNHANPKHIRPIDPIAPPHELRPHYQINICNLLHLPIYIHSVKTRHVEVKRR